jgi:hypothetical protein
MYERVKKTLSMHRSDNDRAKILGISLNEFLNIKNDIKKNSNVNFRNPSATIDTNVASVVPSSALSSSTVNLENGVITQKATVNSKPSSIEDIKRILNLDETKYKLNNYSVWNTGQDKWSVSAKISALTTSDIDVSAKLGEVLANYKSSYKPIERLNQGLNANLNPSLLEVSIADYHIDKLDSDGMSIEEKAKQYLEILSRLVIKAHYSFNIDEIVYVIGNDWFNSDNYQNATTVHMNPQDNNSRWDKAYEVGFDTLVTSIMFLKQFCSNLKVICVQGNHAKTKEFYLAHALEAYFRADSNIVFDRTSANRKIHVYGNTLIGYHHGNCKIDDLPLLMATEFYKEWGASKYKEVHTGDKHFYMEKDVKGVRVKQLPSLTGADRWHDDNNFVQSIRCAVATVYDFEKGKCGEFEERI